MIPSIIILFLQCIVMSLLVVGCYSDLKTRTASHFVSYSIILFSLPLVYLNVSSINISYHIIAITYIILCELNHIGGSDTRVLLAIIYSLNPLHLGIFFIVMIITSLPFALKNPKDIPLFIPIFLAYVLNTFMVYL